MYNQYNNQTKGTPMKSGYSKRVEVWNTKAGQIVKIAVRDEHGKIHGATNFVTKQPTKA
jgi:DUF438 domain-containing protein